MSNRIYAAIAALAVAGFFATIALSQSPEPNYRADINADGEFNSGDQGILAQQIVSGRTVSPNPCVPLEYFDDANPIPTERGLIVDSLGAVVTPRGWSFQVPGEHPGYAVLASGSPWPLVACP